ncbi:lysis system i-spanin subunit Rz [Orbus wheelerorum]|uniref:lysis system i-spanin subunit Rz n=1 Tax=Orbus wheelerorum TaxID=3074111 RepID=UPI00370D1FFD
MSTRFKSIAIIADIAAFGVLIAIFIDINNTYTKLGVIEVELSQVKDEFKQYQKLVIKVNEIDSKFTHELTHAKAENNKLYNNVINGLGRLQLNIDKTTNPPPPTGMMQKTANSLEKLDKIIIYS